MTAQEQQQISIYSKPKTEIAELKKEGKREHGNFMLAIYENMPLEAVFMQGTKNGSLFDFVARHIIASKEKEIEVILPSGTVCKMASENLASVFFGTLFNLVKKEMESTEASKTKKGFYQVPLMVRY